MQDQRANPTLCVGSFYLNYVTITTVTVQLTHEARIIDAVPPASAVTVKEGVFTVRITHSWWRGARRGTSGDRQGYARHARLPVCVLMCAQGCLSWLSVCACVRAIPAMRD